MSQIIELDFLGLPGAPVQAGGATSTNGYAKFVSARNTLSYSQISQLHTCPRRFLLDKTSNRPRMSNLDFAMGHAVGAGVQEYLLSKDLAKAILVSDANWDMPFDEVDPKKKKSTTFSFNAIEKFPLFWQENFDDWELETLPNGRPAIETTIAIKLPTGTFFSAHIDLILRHKEYPVRRVFELKTSGAASINPSIYLNSSQGLGYAALLALIPWKDGEDWQDLEVDYLAYSCPSMEWSFLPYVKTKTQITDWVTDIVLADKEVQNYLELDYFPKRGDGCTKFNRDCAYLNTCDYKISAQELTSIADISEVENPDYVFNLEDLLTKIA